MTAVTKVCMLSEKPALSGHLQLFDGITGLLLPECPGTANSPRSRGRKNPAEAGFPSITHVYHAAYGLRFPRLLKPSKPGPLGIRDVPCRELLGMLGKLGANVAPPCPPIAPLGGKPGCLLIACEGILPIAVLLAGKL